MAWLKQIFLIYCVLITIAAENITSSTGAETNGETNGNNTALGTEGTEGDITLPVDGRDKGDESAEEHTEVKTKVQTTEVPDDHVVDSERVTVVETERRKKVKKKRKHSVVHDDDEESKLVAVETSMEKKLIRDLLRKYNKLGKMGRPIADQTEIMMVKYGLSLIQILDLDERNQVLSTNVWANYEWKDIYLVWDPADYGNITKVRVSKESIWLPDIRLYNYADERLEEKRDTLMVIEYTGTVVWIPQAIFKSSCSIDIKHFPFDIQTCKMKFGSWTYDGSKIDLDLLFSYLDSGFEMSDFVASNEWDVVASSAKKNVITYACCPEPYIDLTFTIQIRRQPAFYNYILILPCILLSSLTLVLFWLPPESPAKMQLGMNIFVAFFVLLLLLAESTPPAASSIPLIGAYYCLNMVMITLSTFLSVVVVNLYFHGARTEVPTIIRKVFINVIARIMCMKDQMVEDEDSHQYHKKQGRLLNKDRVYGEQSLDRIVYTEMPTEDSWKVSNGRTPGNSGTSSTPLTAPPPEQLRSTAQLEKDMREIKLAIRTIMNKSNMKEHKERVAKEWKLVAIVMDRLFFFAYLLVIIVSILTVFDFVLFGKRMD